MIKPRLPLEICLYICNFVDNETLITILVSDVLYMLHRDALRIFDERLGCRTGLSLNDVRTLHRVTRNPGSSRDPHGLVPAVISQQSYRLKSTLDACSHICRAFGVETPANVWIRTAIEGYPDHIINAFETKCVWDELFND